MKTKLRYWLPSTICLLFLWSCQPDAVNPEGNDPIETSSLQGSVNPHPEPNEICSGRCVVPLVDQYGSTIISYCGGQPCPPNQTKWGTVEYYNSPEEFVINITMAADWYVDEVNTYNGAEANLTLINGIPQVDNAWAVLDVNPLVNATQIRVAASDLDQCFQAVNNLVVYKLDAITGNTDQLSVTNLYAFNEQWNDINTPAMNSLSPMVYPWCMVDCPPIIKSVTQGSCHRCDSENTVEFLDCDEVNVSSCKTINNVVLFYDDCTWEKFDNLNATSGSFTGTGSHAGKIISHVYVKSGCNDSYEGPDFGRRFNSPCVNKTCPPVPPSK